MVGLFLELSLGPWFGLDTENGKYEAVGDGNALISFTSKFDIAKAVASLVANVSIDRIPDKILLSGDAVSIRDIARIMQTAGAGREIDVTSVDLEEFKERVLREGGNPAPYLRFLMGEGKIDYSKGNQNELVNPGEGIWKWKSMKEYAEEIGGKPWV